MGIIIPILILAGAIQLGNKYAGPPEVKDLELIELTKDQDPLKDM